MIYTFISSIISNLRSFLTIPLSKIILFCFSFPKQKFDNIKQVSFLKLLLELSKRCLNPDNILFLNKIYNFFLNKKYYFIKKKKKKH